MRGLFPARSGIAIAVVVVVPLTLAGCSRIDQSQWREVGIHTEQWRDLPTIDSNRESTGGGSANTASTQGSGGAAPTSVVDPNDNFGVVPGAVGGGIRPDPATVVVEATGDTCWWLTVDGVQTSGCGNGSVTDAKGRRAGRVIKRSGVPQITLRLVGNDGAVIDVGVVSGIDHFVTVTNNE